jgi:uncharacterized Zn-binding protein involved in type VI secretion
VAYTYSIPIKSSIDQKVTTIQTTGLHRFYLEDKHQIIAYNLVKNDQLLSFDPMFAGSYIYNYKYGTSFLASDYFVFGINKDLRPCKINSRSLRQRRYAHGGSSVKYSVTGFACLTCSDTWVNVYNMTIMKYHNFFISPGILVSNCTGHADWPPRGNVQGSPNVFVNSKPWHRKTDAWAVHCNPLPECHDSVLAGGSSTVSINNLAAGRIGDSVACGGTVAQGSPTVICG